MNKDIGDTDLDKELESLELFEPSMRFSKNVVERVKLKTELIKPERGPMYWLPWIFAGSALAVFMLVLGLLLLRQGGLPEIVLSEQMSQAAMVTFGTLAGLTLLLGMDRVFKKLMLG
ncbi:MAG: hypothetical protein HEP71_08685 [Roseivirga sp.]|nr:hypothetical protein [Roseivirga sp.]